MISQTLESRQSTDCEHRLGVIQSWIGESLENFPTEEELHDAALRTMPNLPSLARGHLFRMSAIEVRDYKFSERRYQIIETPLNQPAVDAVFAQY